MSQNAIQVDLQKCPDEVCECGCPFYENRTIIKRIPGLMAGSTSDQFAPVNFYACKFCGIPHKATKIAIPQWSPKFEG